MLRPAVTFVVVLGLVGGARAEPLVAKDNHRMKYGYVDPSGELVVPYKYAAAWSFDGAGVAWVRDTNESSYSLIDTTGREILRRKYFYVSRFKEGLALVSTRGNSFGFIDTRGRQVIAARYDDARDFHDGLASVRRTPTSKRGYIDRRGKMVIPAIYDTAGDFYHGVAMVTVGGAQTVITKSGKPAFDLGANRIVSSFNASGLAIIRSPDNKLGAIDVHGKLVIPPKYNLYGLDNFEFDYTRAGLGTKMGLIDKSGRELTTFSYDTIIVVYADAAMFRVGALWGIMDQHGRELVPAGFMALKAMGDGFFAAQGTDRLWSMVDRTGRVYTKRKYTSPMSTFEHDGYRNVYATVLEYAPPRPGVKTRMTVIFLDPEGNEIDLLAPTR